MRQKLSKDDQNNLESFSEKLSAFCLGKSTSLGETIIWRAPSFDCAWYWGFGYLGNPSVHYHLSSLPTTYNTNYFEAIRKEFPEAPFTDKDLWIISEIISTVYTLRNTAEIYYLGGANYVLTNPDKENLCRFDWYKKITTEDIPNQLKALQDIFNNYPEFIR